MALDLTAMATQIAGILQQVPFTFTLGTVTTKTYTGTKSFLRKEIVSGNAGLANVYEFSVLCLASQFATVPVPKTTLTAGGTTYKILSVDTDTTGITIRLHLGSVFA